MGIRMLINKQKRNERVEKSFQDIYDFFEENIEKEDKLVLFISSSDLIDKSYIIVRLARKFVKEGKKILLLDANLKNSSISQVSKVEFSRGLSDILVKDMPYENIITKDLYEEDLSMILAGDSLENSASYLSLSTFKNLLQSLKVSYDFIFINSPSGEYLEDIEVISQSVNKVLIMTNKGDKRKKKLHSVISALECNGADIAGIIMTDAK